MNSLTKKVVIYSLVAILQCGIGAATIEASPRQDDRQHNERDNRDRHEHQRFENGHRDRDDREMRRHEENDRHEREMMRRQHEREWEWRERQRIENERHDQFVRDIEAAAIIYLLLSK